MKFLRAGNEEAKKDKQILGRWLKFTMNEANK